MYFDENKEDIDRVGDGSLYKIDKVVDKLNFDHNEMK